MRISLIKFTTSPHLRLTTLLHWLLVNRNPKKENIGLLRRNVFRFPERRAVRYVHLIIEPDCFDRIWWVKTTALAAIQVQCSGPHGWRGPLPLLPAPYGYAVHCVGRHASINIAWQISYRTVGATQANIPPTLFFCCFGSLAKYLCVGERVDKLRGQVREIFLNRQSHYSRWQFGMSRWLPTSWCFSVRCGVTNCCSVGR